MADHFDAPCRDSPGSELLRAEEDRFGEAPKQIFRLREAREKGRLTFRPKLAEKNYNFA